MNDLHKLESLRHMGLVCVFVARMGPCKRCGFREDLWFGSCFQCSQYVCGKNHGDGIHELWDRKNPTNRWLVVA